MEPLDPRLTGQVCLACGAPAPPSPEVGWTEVTILGMSVVLCQGCTALTLDVAAFARRIMGVRVGHGR